MLALSALQEVPDVPTARRRLLEKRDQWIAEKQRQGKYPERSGRDVSRFIGHCADWVSGVGPEAWTEDELLTVLDHVGGERRPKTMRWYLGMLGSFLSWCGNPIVQTSGIRSRFPNRAMRTPVVSPDDRDRVMNAAQGQERLVTALLGVGRRKIEIQRAKVDDFRMEEIPPSYHVRQKGGRGEVTDAFVLTPMIMRELAWYLPLRTSWSEGARRDDGSLICRRNGRDLVGVSTAYLDRLLHSAERRAGTQLWPAHAFRRSTATLLRQRGADWEDVSMALGHRSAETTRQYVEPLIRRDRVAQALRLLEPISGGKV